MGWTVADSVLRWHLVKEGRLATDQPLSARHVWMAAKETDQREEYPSTFLEQDGTSLKAGLDVVRKFGAVLESELPWNGLAHGSPEELLPRRRSRAGSWPTSTSATTASPDRDGALRPSGASGCTRAGRSRPDRARPPHPAPRSSTRFDPDSVTGSHAAALFGYGPDHFLLRSSWGPDWGDGGYAKMSLDYAAQAVIESYGVMV